eukprot:m.34283 g.34283  ORF g.34283 m.34283 type:complete len:175 (+) comp9916_c0_seq5:505-1029(+)
MWYCVLCDCVKTCIRKLWKNVVATCLQKPDEKPFERFPSLYKFKTHPHLACTLVCCGIALRMTHIPISGHELVQLCRMNKLLYHNAWKKLPDQLVAILGDKIRAFAPLKHAWVQRIESSITWWGRYLLGKKPPPIHPIAMCERVCSFARLFCLFCLLFFSRGFIPFADANVFAA